MRNSYPRICGLFLVLILAGCDSATKTTSFNALAINKAAFTGDQHLDNALLLTGGATYEEELVTEIKAAKVEFKKINIGSANIIKVIPELTDKKGWFEKLIETAKLWGMVALVLVAVGAAIYFGIGQVIRKFFHTVGLLLPTRQKNKAKLAVRLKEGRVSVDEYLTAERSDEVFNQAYIHEKRKKKLDSS